MSLERQLGKFTTAKDKLAGFYKEYVFEGGDVEKAEEYAVMSLYRIPNDETKYLFEQELKELFEENGRGERFLELKNKHKK